MHHSSHDQGVSVQGGVYPGGSPSRGEVSVQGVSVQGSLSGGSLSRGCPGWSLCKEGGLCPGRGVSVQGEALSGRVSVWGVSIREIPPYGNERALRILLECILVHLL